MTGGVGETEIRAAVARVVSRMAGVSRSPSAASEGIRRVVSIGVSSRHLHLQPDHVEALFGRGHKLTRMRDLVQHGQFACKETVTLIGPQGRIPAVRVLGPERPQTQIEASITDLMLMGITAPLRLSGDLGGSAALKIRGTRGLIQIAEGLIIAHRHMHISDDEARRYGVKTGDRVSVRTRGTRPAIFEDVIVRAGPDHRLEFHLDTDEANAAGVQTGDMAEIIGG